MIKFLKKKWLELMKDSKLEHASDRKLIIVVGILVVFGLLMLSSATSVVAYAKFGNSYYYLTHQLIGLVLGIGAFFIISRIDYHHWRNFAFGFLMFSIALLLLVFIPGLSAKYGTARSWINVFGFSLQPSEFVKLSFLIYLSAWLEGRKGELQDIYKGIGPFVAILGFIGFLMFLQPDMGTLFIIAVTSLIVFFIAGAMKRHIIVIIVVASLALVLLLQIKPYQMDRFRCLANPEFSTSDTCYQVNQSLIAVGSGGFWGRGLGQSRQKFLYLPEVSGDSIFPIIAEELGFIFSTILILLFVYIFYRGYIIAKYAPDNFGRLLAIGIVSWIAIQALVNIGGMLNIMPMTGVPLPFISSGGSSILSALVAVGILINISKQTVGEKSISRGRRNEKK